MSTENNAIRTRRGFLSKALALAMGIVGVSQRAKAYVVYRCCTLVWEPQDCFVCSQECHINGYGFTYWTCDYGEGEYYCGECIMDATDGDDCEQAGEFNTYCSCAD
jgi:hypothetical protein